MKQFFSYWRQNWKTHSIILHTHTVSCCWIIQGVPHHSLSKANYVTMLFWSSWHSQKQLLWFCFNSKYGSRTQLTAWQRPITRVLTTRLLCRYGNRFNFIPELLTWDKVWRVSISAILLLRKTFLVSDPGCRIDIYALFHFITFLKIICENVRPRWSPLVLDA